MSQGTHRWGPPCCCAALWAFAFRFRHMGTMLTLVACRVAIVHNRVCWPLRGRLVGEVWGLTWRQECQHGLIHLLWVVRALVSWQGGYAPGTSPLSCWALSGMSTPFGPGGARFPCLPPSFSLALVLLLCVVPRFHLRSRWRLSTWVYLAHLSTHEGGGGSQLLTLGVVAGIPVVIPLLDWLSVGELANMGLTCLAPIPFLLASTFSWASGSSSSVLVFSRRQAVTWRASRHLRWVVSKRVCWRRWGAYMGCP